ncbi:MAG: hypothetical protein HON04_06000 [Planctomicrobium sp.]|jgi:hypothetical protein|nr:hypothetical protein [Planctomicrobium sp.]
MAQRILIFIYELLLLLIAISSEAAWINMLMLQLTLVPMFVELILSAGSSTRFTRVLPIILSNVLLASGFWFGLPSNDLFTHQAGIVLMCVGVGGLTGWFPVFGKQNTQKRLSRSLIPICLAAIFFYRTVQTFIWSEQDLALLAVISLFSLAICGIRLMGPLLMEQRIHFSILTILSNANIATILIGWEKLFPARTWIGTSNIPSGKFLLIAILVTESFAAILMILSHQRFIKEENGNLNETDFVIKMNSSPWLGKIFLAGNLSMAGFPMFPGSIWRFALLAALILPHEKSNVTQLAEPHRAFIFLAIVFMLATILVTLGQVRMLQRYIERNVHDREFATVSNA